MVLCVRLLGSLADGADAARLEAKNGKPRAAPWRPKGSVKNPHLHFLIGSLYRSIVKDADGKLAVRKGKICGEAKGTLPTVLTILRPYLPRIIPTKLPYSTSRRVLQKVSQA
jgi:hypothetical protein